jgi:hypothetical protein
MEFSVRAATNDELLFTLDELRRREREVLPDLLACLSEVERRGLHLDLSYSNLFEYCVSRLRYSEGGAAKRVRAARAAARFPELYVLIRDGEISLTAVSRLEPHLTAENVRSVLPRAVGKRQREIEELVVELVAARADVVIPSPIQELPEPALALFAGAPIAEPPIPEAENAVPRPARPTPPERRPDVVRLEAPGVVRFSFQASPKLRESLDRLKRLSRRICPNGRLEELIELAVDDSLAHRDPARRGASPEKEVRAVQTHRIPRWVKDRVWSRDGGRCAYVWGNRRCESRAGLEYDHVIPWARGGKSDDPGNVRLLCRAHNLHLARREFGGRRASVR